MMWVGEFYQMRGRGQICNSGQYFRARVRGNGLCRQESPLLWEWLSEQLGSVEEAKCGQGGWGNGWTRTEERQARQRWEEVAVCG